jgi:hypothetical protein
MTQYVRVRDKATKHLIDIPVAKAALLPDRYTVVDDVPVGAPREPELYVRKRKFAAEPTPSEGSE